MVRTQLWFDPIVNPQTLQIQLFWTLRPANIGLLHIPPSPTPTHTLQPPTLLQKGYAMWNVNLLMLMSSMLMLVVLMWWYLSCPAKITLWASTSWPSSQARVTSAKSLSFLKFLIFQLCHSYWPNTSSENMRSSTKTQPFTSRGFRKSESLGVQDSGSHNIENARKILHFDIFSFSCLNPSISEKKKKFIQNRHNHHRGNIQHNRALEKMNIQHNRGLLRSRSNIWSGGAVKLWLPWSNGCSSDYDYDDFWMKIRYEANFWSRSRIWEVKKREIIRISLGIHFWGFQAPVNSINGSKRRRKIESFRALFFQNFIFKTIAFNFSF